MKEIIFNSISLSDFELKPGDIFNLDERTVVVTKWNWEYTLAHKFQRAALKLVQDSSSLRILISCSHPEVLTYGRGLQKPKKGELFSLKDFDPSEHSSLPYPIHKVERGGGLTFHHPGQFVFYPILKLNPAKLSLSLMTDQIFDFSIDVLKCWGLSDIHHENRLLGLWHGNKKLASMGIAIEKLTTFHGMALNLKNNEAMLRAMSKLNPCGLNAETYTSVENLMALPSDFLNLFQDKFLQRIRNEWK